MLLYWHGVKGLQIPEFLCVEQELFGQQFASPSEQKEPSGFAGDVTCLGFAKD